MTEAKAIRETPGFQILGSVPQHPWFSLRRHRLLNSPGGCAVLLSEGVCVWNALGSGCQLCSSLQKAHVHGMSHQSPRLPAPRLSACFSPPSPKRGGQRSHRATWIPQWLREKCAKAVGVHPAHYPFTPAPGLTRRRRKEVPPPKIPAIQQKPNLSARDQEGAVSDCPQGVDILLGADRWCRGLVCSMAMRAVEKNQRKGVGSAGQGWNICGFKLGIRGRSPQSVLTLLLYNFTCFLSKTLPYMCSVAQSCTVLWDPWTVARQAPLGSKGHKGLDATERLNTHRERSHWENK